MVIMDATVLLLLLNEQTAPPRDPSNHNEPIDDAHQRVKHLAHELGKKGEQVLIVAPVLAELLVRAEAAATVYMTEFRSSALFKIASFDQKAAIEHSIYTKKAIESGDKRQGVPESWLKVKFDRQIVAIAKAEGAHTIYSDDKHLKTHAEQQGITVITTAELVLNEQPTLFPVVGPAIEDIALEKSAAVPTARATQETPIPITEEQSWEASEEEVSKSKPEILSRAAAADASETAPKGKSDEIVEIPPPNSRS